MKNLNEMTELDVIKLGGIAVLALGLTAAFWPIKTVDTGNRGVITVGGAIKGIENEGFTFVLPW